MGQKIYLDTNLYIAFFEGGSLLSNRIEKLLLDSAEKDIEIIASPIVVMELLVSPLRDNQDQLINVYKNLTNHISNMNFVDFTPKIAEIAAKLRAKYDLATPDCIHLATAISEKVDVFYTADKGIKKVKEIKVEQL